MADLPADARTVYFAETLLSGAIGGASARVMVASVTQEEALGLDEVLDILDEASQIRAYSHELERKSRELEAATAELRAANLRLQELDRLKDDFMSSVTHELRTPLASIRAFSEILHDDPDMEEAERNASLVSWSARPSACRAWSIRSWIWPRSNPATPTGGRAGGPGGGHRTGGDQRGPAPGRGRPELEMDLARGRATWSGRTTTA